MLLYKVTRYTRERQISISLALHSPRGPLVVDPRVATDASVNLKISSVYREQFIY